MKREYSGNFEDFERVHMRGEEWRPVVGFEKYEISSHGRVRSYVRPAKPRILRPWATCNGYQVVGFSSPNGYKKKALHQVVLEAFIGLKPDGMEACHNNGIRSDNRAENLRWDTRAGNFADKLAHGTSNRGENHGMAKLRDRDVVIIKMLIRSGKPVPHIASKFKVSKTTIKRIRRGFNWNHVRI